MFLDELSKLKKDYFFNFLLRDLSKFPLYRNNLFPGVKKHDDVNKILTPSQLNHAKICDIPKFLVLIEFDHQSKLDCYDYDFARNEAVRNIKIIIDYLNANDIYYILTDHNFFGTSKSPHLYILLDFEMYPKDVDLIQSYKKYFFDRLLNKLTLTYHFVKVDNGFLRSDSTFPVVGNPHFKPKHRGSIQEIIEEGSGAPFFVSVNDFKLLKHYTNVSNSVDEKISDRVNKYTKKYFKDLNLNLDILHLFDVFSDVFLPGQHNFAFLSIASFLAFYGVPEYVSRDIANRLISREGLLEEHTKYHNILDKCYSIDNKAYKHWLGMIYSASEVESIVSKWKSVLLKK